MNSCTTLHCPNPATDEYHWYEEIDYKGVTGTVEVIWVLCDECLTFAEEVVECISNLDDEGAWNE